MRSKNDLDASIVLLRFVSMGAAVAGWSGFGEECVDYSSTGSRLLIIQKRN